MTKCDSLSVGTVYFLCYFTISCLCGFRVCPVDVFHRLITLIPIPVRSIKMNETHRNVIVCVISSWYAPRTWKQIESN